MKFKGMALKCPPSFFQGETQFSEVHVKLVEVHLARDIGKNSQILKISINLNL